jgi:hypothetical protein
MRSSAPQKPKFKKERLTESQSRVDWRKQRETRQMPLGCAALNPAYATNLKFGETMKKQITRLSPHQNGKVFGIMMATSSVPIMLLSVIIFELFAPTGMTQSGAKSFPPLFIFIVFPFAYLIIGYIFVGIGCLIYNMLFNYIGGFEFEVSEKETSSKVG